MLKAKVYASDRLLLGRSGGKGAGAWPSEFHGGVKIPTAWDFFVPRPHLSQKGQHR
jgi:hypothetical protein